MSKINIFTDGASRGNPGLSGIGVAVYDGKEIKEKITDFLGKKTNNQAEYTAVIRALEYLKKNKIKEANLFSDSEFLVKQLNGVYKVKSINIKPLYDEVQKLLNSGLKLSFHWIPREDNKLADELANISIDERNKKSFKINSNKNLNNLNIKLSNNLANKSNNLIDHLKLDKAFFGQINCLKIQMNSQFEIYFHMGITKKGSGVWKWEKVKMSDIELGEIINILRKETAKCSFFHAFGDKKTQIWCNKNPNSFSIKIKDVSKNLSVGEFETLRIILEECIRLKNF